MADTALKVTSSNEKDVVTYVEDVHVEPELDKVNLEKADYASNLLASGRIEMTREELTELEDKLDDMPSSRARQVLSDIYKIHRHDPRYDTKTLERMRMFVSDDSIAANPEMYGELIYEMRIFALLATTMSAYPEVRAVAANTDDPSMPSLTLRVWVIGTLFSAIGIVINTVFTLRYPSISIGGNVVQLMAYPAGLFMAKVIPKVKVFGCSLNPGPFNRKEHMLITIMCGLGMAWPPTNHLIWAQAMPQFFGMEYARNPGYQFLGALGTNMIGFGFAGLTRRFLVFPSYCIWPASLATVALNNALHEAGSIATPVRGPMGTIWRASMFKCFYVVFGFYFVYFFFPGYMFPNLTFFDWMAWIKPTSGKLVAMTSVNFGVGLGFNPFPTFDYNFLANPGGYFPMYIHWNFLVATTVALLVTTILWFRNAWNTGYLMISSPNTFDNTGKKYKVANIVDKAGRLVLDKYQTYSEPYMSARTLVGMMGTMMYTTGTLTHTLLYNRHELIMGFKSMWADTRRWYAKIRGRLSEEEERMHFGDDIHYTLMRAYPEVPEWWFTIVVLISMILSMVCLGVYTEVSPAVVMIAPIVTVVFLIPVGIVTAISNLEPSLNLISELIGGGIAPGDTMTVQYFRMFGSEPVYHALIYANDLKMGQYVHIPPRHMFYCADVVCRSRHRHLGGPVELVNGHAENKLTPAGLCTDDAPFRLICPGVQGDYSNFIFWGTLGAKRLFGPGGRFSLILLGLPIGILFPLLMFYAKKLFPRSEILQSSHPLLLMLAFAWTGGGHWGAYVPGMFINYFSWNYLKPKFMEFWRRYNYVTLAALGASISINALITFFALVFPGINFPTWWGNPEAQPGCIGKWTNEACGLYKIHAARGFFGPDPGNFH